MNIIAEFIFGTRHKKFLRLYYSFLTLFLCKDIITRGIGRETTPIPEAPSFRDGLS
jgi:hypothetical protein